MATASDLFIEALEAEGVKYIFGVPGEENLDFLDSLSRSKQIKLILTRHEQAAGFMAATYGRFTGKTGVCLATLGPGATNLVTAAAYATLGGMPMMMITGQKPVRKSKQGRFQILDVVDMMGPVTKYTHQLASADNLPARIREAFRIAEEEKPGAVHLELPEDIAREQTTEQPISAAATRRPVAEDKAVRAAIDKIAAAKAPILVIGSGANRKRCSNMLTRLVERRGIPFVTTQLGKGVVDEDSPLFMGTAALSKDDFVHRAIEASDCIINVGHDVIEKPPFFMEKGGTEVIHISFSSAEIDPVYFPQVEVVGDIANAIWQIEKALPKGLTWENARMQDVKRALKEHDQRGIDDNRYPIYPRRLVADIRKVMPDRGILCLDNGVYKIWFARSYPARLPNTVLLDNALASMGAGLPSAMAAHLVYPDQKVLAVCGDGGFMMNSQEIETAVRLKMNLTCLVVNDASYGMIRWKQADMGYQDWGLTYGNPDFVAYAESYGAKGHRVETADALAPLLSECFSTPGVHLVDCPVDYSENVSVMFEEIPRLSSQV